VADLLALEALHELEFQSLGKGGGHVRGVVGSISLPVTANGAYESPSPRGGPASADAPTYDIDVSGSGSGRSAFRRISCISL
jgi:hypothetical protein